MIMNLNKHPFRNLIFDDKFTDIKKFIEHLACVYKGVYYAKNNKHIQKRTISSVFLPDAKGTLQIFKFKK
jgi:hypothetical protein